MLRQHLLQVAALDEGNGRVGQHDAREQDDEAGGACQGEGQPPAPGVDVVGPADHVGVRLSLPTYEDSPSDTACGCCQVVQQLAAACRSALTG